MRTIKSSLQSLAQARGYLMQIFELSRLEVMPSTYRKLVAYHI